MTTTFITANSNTLLASETAKSSRKVNIADRPDDDNDESRPQTRFKTPGIPYDQWDDCCLRQLFDPAYIDHLPVKEQLKYYKHRNMAKSKLYNMARRVWGDRHLGPRWRMIETSGGGTENKAQPSDLEQELMSHEKNKRLPNYPPAHGTIGGSGGNRAGRTLLWNDDEDFPDMKSSEFYVPRNRRPPFAPLDRKLTNQNSVPETEKKATNQIEALKLQANVEERKQQKIREENYRKWVKDRQELRQGLDRMDDLERWLSSKPDVSPLEAVVLKRFLEWKFEQEELKRKKPPKIRTPSSVTSVAPEIERPLPVMIAVLEAYLQEHKLRLVDYFSMTDKKKKWTLGRDELRAIIAWTKLPVTDAELDDFIQYLDHSGGGYLEYKDIARTRTRFLSEERKAILEEYGGEIGTVLAEQKRAKARAEKEAERARKAEELRNQRREASFVAYEGDRKLYKVTYGDPRKPPNGKKKKQSQAIKKESTSQQEENSTSDANKSRLSSSTKSPTNDVMARRRKETIAMRRRLFKSKLNSAPPDGRSNESQRRGMREEVEGGNFHTVEEHTERADSRTDFKSDREGIETPTRRHKHNDSDNQNSKRRNKSAVTWSETNRHQQGEREWTPVQVERYRELGMRRAADILNSRSPSAPPSEPDIPDPPESPFIRTPTPTNGNNNNNNNNQRSPVSKAAGANIPPLPKSSQSGRSLHSGATGSFATTRLETPPIDTNEAIEFDDEMFFDKAKRLQYHTRLNKERQKNPRMLEPVPLMVRSGDPEVDSHMAFCTRWDPLIIHERRQQFRQLTWMEYEKCVKLCEQKGIPLTEKTLKRALLHPADLRLTVKDKVRVPGIAVDFPRGEIAKKKETDEDDEEDEDERLLEYMAVSNLTNALFSFANNLNKDTKGQAQGQGELQGAEADDDTVSTASSDLDSIDYKIFKPNAKNASNPACLYPKHRPRKEIEPMKLSTGPSFVSSKIDNWISYKDFLKISKRSGKKQPGISYHGFYDERKMWPGQMYKTRLPEDTRVKHEETMFQRKPDEKPQFKGKTTIYSHLVK